MRSTLAIMTMWLVFGTCYSRTGPFPLTTSPTLRAPRSHRKAQNGVQTVA